MHPSLHPMNDIKKAEFEHLGMEPDEHFLYFHNEDEFKEKYIWMKNHEKETKRMADKTSELLKPYHSVKRAKKC